MSDSDLHELAGPAIPGVSRRIPFEGDEYWFGCAEIAPHLMSGWHHHDRNVTLGYVLEGAFHLEYGPGGREQADVKAGQYFLMPPWVIHREGTATDEPCRVPSPASAAGLPWCSSTDQNPARTNAQPDQDLPCGAPCKTARLDPSNPARVEVAKGSRWTLGR